MYSVSSKFILLLSLAVVGFGAGCQQSQQTPSENRLAKVGTEILTIEEATSQIPDHILAQDSLSSLQQYRQDWIQRQLILQEANRLGIQQNADVQKRLQRLREEVLIQGLKDYVMGNFDNNLTITDEDARNYYQAHKDQLVLDEKYVRFRHLVAGTHQAAQSARQDIMGGIEWPEVARKYAQNAEAAIQESEKFWPISMALADNEIMNTMIQRIGITEISPIRRVNGNYHFVQLMETRAAGGHPDLDWLMSQIKEWLLLERRRRHFNSYVKNLYLKAQSNNEIDTYNVLEANAKPEPFKPDTVGFQETNE